MIYVMSDIHGYKKRFDKMLKLINLQPDDHLYILGDVIDRGPAGIKILQQIMKMDNVTMLLGNHEEMMLESLHYPIKTKNESKRAAIRRYYSSCWYENGGDVTHESIKQISEEEKEEIFKWIEELPINIDVEVNGQKFLLVHGAPIETFGFSRSYYNDPKTHALWTRLESFDRLPEDKIVIFGHTPTCDYQDNQPFEIYHAGDRIGIDCGCGYGPIGRLACLRLNDLEEFYVN